MSGDLAIIGAELAPGISADELITYIDPDGNETPLYQGGIRTLGGVKGRFMPPVDLGEDFVPQQAGSRFDEAFVRPRDVDVPLLVTGASAAALRLRLRDLVTAVDPDLGVGILRVDAPDGARRELNCMYRAGLELDERGTAGGETWQKMVAIFHAFDPYWYDTASVVSTYTLGGPAPSFFPFFPMMLGASEVFSDATVTNDGDATAWPVWTITGPCTNLVLRNLTTGKELSLEVTLDDGETVVIDTRPDYKTVTHSDGSNLYGLLGSGSSMWLLAKGSNAIRIEMTGATEDSAVQLSYRRRYLTP